MFASVHTLVNRSIFAESVKLYANTDKSCFTERSYCVVCVFHKQLYPPIQRKGIRWGRRVVYTIFFLTVNCLTITQHVTCV